MVKKKNVRAATFPTGYTLKDTQKNEWVIKEVVGCGGFGDIYGVKKVGDAKNTYVAKIEPSCNSCLFVEMHFFLKHLRPKNLDEWKAKHKLPFLGLPQYHGGGVFNHANLDHRFLIMDRLGEPFTNRIQKDGAVNLKLLGTFCAQIIDALRYVHEKGYIHGDIKGDNLLTKYKDKRDFVYLVDFGICRSYNEKITDKPDKKFAHDGTLLFSSRDSHLGIATKRSDFESLGYNLLIWCGAILPWMEEKKEGTVAEKKEEFAGKLKQNLAKFQLPKPVVSFVTYVAGLKSDETPDYEKMKKILGDLNGSAKLLTATSAVAAGVKRKSSEGEEEVVAAKVPKAKVKSMVAGKKIAKGGKNKDSDDDVDDDGSCENDDEKAAFKSRARRKAVKNGNAKRDKSVASTSSLSFTEDEEWRKPAGKKAAAVKGKAAGKKIAKRGKKKDSDEGNDNGKATIKSRARRKAVKNGNAKRDESAASTSSRSCTEDEVRRKPAAAAKGKTRAGKGKVASKSTSSDDEGKSPPPVKRGRKPAKK